MMRGRRRQLVAAALLSAVLAGCAASAQFYSKNGQDYSRLTDQVVLCEDAEIQTVMAAGGFPIGVVDARALMVEPS